MSLWYGIEVSSSDSNNFLMGHVSLHVYTCTCRCAYCIGGVMDLKARLVSSNVME